MNTIESHAGPHGPRPAYSLRTTALGTALTAATFLAATLAVTHPAASAAALLALAAAAIARRQDGLRLARRRTGSRRVCIPSTGVCIEA